MPMNKENDPKQMIVKTGKWNSWQTAHSWTYEWRNHGGNIKRFDDDFDTIKSLRAVLMRSIRFS